MSENPKRYFYELPQVRDTRNVMRGVTLGIFICLVINLCVLLAMKKTPQPVISPVPDVCTTPTPTPTATPTMTPKAPTTVRGTATYYSRAGCLGCSKNFVMANGAPLNDDALTIAYNRARLGTVVEIQNTANGRRAVATITDRGGFESHGHIADMTPAVKTALDCTDICHISITILGGGEK